jgi:hypothetical protein
VSAANAGAEIKKTTKRRGNGGVVERGENQEQVFTAFHNALGIRQNAADSHIPTAPAAVGFNRTKQEKTERKSAAAQPPFSDLFQDHVALETLLAFRIIRRLENAGPSSALPDRLLGKS